MTDAEESALALDKLLDAESFQEVCRSLEDGLEGRVGRQLEKGWLLR